MNAPRTGGMRQSSTAVIPPRHAHAVAAVANLRDETTTDAQSRVREQPSIVAALCTCLLGEGEGRESADWPPQSVAEMSGRSGGQATGTTPDPGVLEQGLDALDELALRETGWRFARLDRPAQLRSLFHLEAGLGRLSRRRASAFMDAFLSLAAQAYLSVIPWR